MLSLAKIFTITLTIGQVLAETNGPVVCIENGCIRGKVMSGYASESFDAFLGIPFAKPPVGMLRFQNPEPADTWPDTLITQTEKNMCIQKNYLVPRPVVTGDEDCLYLYVYKPSKIRSLLPVMVYIHGGGYFAGAGGPSIVGPEYFMDTGKVILVSVQYRLGVIGFLSTGDSNSSGNFGLKDQAMALKWVKANIEYFGGDHNRITVFGQSAGAASTHMHMMSPLSRDLINQVIVLSGNAIAPYNEVNQNPIELARRHALVVGVEQADRLPVKDLMAKLRLIDATTLVDGTERLKFWSVDPLTLYGPVVEDSIVSNGFLYQDPQQMWKDGNFKQMPWMTGTVSNDGAVRALAIITNDTLLEDLNENLDLILPKLLQLKGSHWMIQEKLRKIKKRYFNGRNRLTKTDSQIFTDLYSDIAFIHPLYKSIKQYVAKANFVKNPVHLYKFEFKGLLSYSVLYTGTYIDYGVVHCDELIYLFRSPAIFPMDFDRNSTEAQMIKMLTNYFADFATNGVPPYNVNTKLCKCPSQCSTMPKCDYHKFVRSNTTETGVDIIVSNKIDQQMLLFWNSLEK